MTEDKVDENGPYFVTTETDSEIGAKWFLVNGPGIKTPFTTATQDRYEAMVSVKLRNNAYSEGKKAEREKLHRIIMGDTNESRP